MLSTPVSTLSTLGELREAVGAGRYCRQSVKNEIRQNLIQRLRTREPLFPGIIGYDETVVPQIVNAILYLNRTGCQWRFLPRDFPPPGHVSYYYYLWMDDGTWEQIVGQMRDASTGPKERTVEEFLQAEARRGFALTGVLIPTRDAESFLRASADAGLLRIIH